MPGEQSDCPRLHMSQTLEAALQAVQKILPKLEARIIEFLAEWLVTFLMASNARIRSEGIIFPLCCSKNTGLRTIPRP